ncbi:hypothetical protein LXL04_023780 [Taraxacum kok-saghyz]
MPVVEKDAQGIETKSPQIHLQGLSLPPPPPHQDSLLSRLSRFTLFFPNSLNWNCELQFFNSQGYLVIESFSSSEEVEALRKRMDQLLDGFDCSSSTSIFSTKNQQRTSDDYFYDSADKISFFFEGSFMPYLEHMIQFFVFYVLIFSNYLTEKAFDDDGNLKQPKQLSINKVGHGSTSSSIHQVFDRVGRKNEKLYLWISKQYAEGLGVTTEDILAYIQAELESSVEESPMAPRTLQPTQVTNPFINPGSTSVPAGVQSLLSDHPSKNYIFSNALSSPVRRSLRNYHISSSQDHSFDSSMDADTTCQ